MATDYPIAPLLPQLLEHLQRQPRLVLEAPPGAGKTTQVPPALLEAEWLGEQRIIMLEPRRLAARAAAGFMAAQRGEAVGHGVGYRIRFESRVSAATRIEIVTEGLFTRMIQGDPTLAGIGAVIFDEFHERHLGGDLGVAMALDVQTSVRPDLRIVVMSATLDGERMARWLNAPQLCSAGRSHAVDIEYPDTRAQETLLAQLLRLVPDALARTPGDALVFLPGKRDIERARQALDTRHADDVEVLTMHGDLSLAEQSAALLASESGTRRVILATNVAESSVTLPGIRIVIDSGLAREPRFDPRSGLTRLQTVAISQASADQRAGRAGRVAPGIAYRLWPQSKRLDAARRPEIMQVELSSLALELAAWGSDRLQWLDAPPPGALAQARTLLQQLGALDADARITAHGHAMLELGAPPRLAAAVVRAAPAQRVLMPDLLALLESRSSLRNNDDVRQQLAALHAWRDGGAHAARLVGAESGKLAAIEQLARGWRHRLRVKIRASGVPGPHSVGNLLLHAFPDRIAHVDAGNPLRYQLAGGRGARLHESSTLRGEPWLVAIDLSFDERDSLILAAAPIDPVMLHRDYQSHFFERRTQQWSDARQTAEAFVERCFDAIVLERRKVALRETDTEAALLDAIRQRGLDALAWSDATRQWRTRVICLRRWCPALGLPDLSDAALLATLDTWLAPYMVGKTRLGAMGSTDLDAALRALLDHQQHRAVDAQAPCRLRVPSGHEQRIDYQVDAAPILAVKLQELFGLADTPRIAGGSVALTLHLLSPARRPIQVTQDLGSFWKNTYPEVKKELKGRYPKHPWPDDPWTAAPTAHVKRRR